MCFMILVFGPTRIKSLLRQILRVQIWCSAIHSNSLRYHQRSFGRTAAIAQAIAVAAARTTYIYIYISFVRLFKLGRQDLAPNAKRMLKKVYLDG